MAIDYKLMRATGGLPKNAELKVITVERQTAGLRQMSKSIEQATSLTTIAFIYQELATSHLH